MRDEELDCVVVTTKWNHKSIGRYLSLACVSFVAKRNQMFSVFVCFNNLSYRDRLIGNSFQFHCYQAMWGKKNSPEIQVDWSTSLKVFDQSSSSGDSNPQSEAKQWRKNFWFKSPEGLCCYFIIIVHRSTIFQFKLNTFLLSSVNGLPISLSQEQNEHSRKNHQRFIR